jgi:hypothetical protein
LKEDVAAQVGIINLRFFLEFGCWLAIAKGFIL